MVWLIMLFSMISLVGLMAWGTDNELHRTIAWGLLGLIFSISGSYIFGAVWDDKNWMIHAGGRKE